MKRILVGIPTLNEAKNVELMIARLGKLVLPLDLFFVDDSSSDGTAQILDRIAVGNPTVNVLHRPFASGIGSAHQAILRFAYKHGYKTLITMDCDFSHQPEDIPRLLAIPDEFSVGVGSRFMDPRSLADWNLKRKFLTHLGHWLTSRFLRLPMDATGAFRLYRLASIPQCLWSDVRSQGYAFFFESLAILQKHGFKISEISIRLPKRVYGESKLNFRQALRSLLALFRLCFFPGSAANTRNDAEGWDHYWRAGPSGGRQWYAFLASIYRRFFIVRRLRFILEKHFPPKAYLYHVGCGGGEVDKEVAGNYQIVGVDISTQARVLYAKHYPQASVQFWDILKAPLMPPLAGVYSLGLVEHFSHEEIVRIFVHMRKSVVMDGKIVIFWPHRHAPSVVFLGLVSWFRRLLGIREPLHPPEPSLLHSRKEAEILASLAGCKIIYYEFGPRDLWIQAAIVMEAIHPGAPESGHCRSERLGAKTIEFAH